MHMYRDTNTHKNGQIVGYVTGTFDLGLHSSHHRLLEACKQQCDVLIVGLVTDSTGMEQKRIPIFTYEERRASLESTKWVDIVVEHNGESKALAFQKLRFDVLFSGDEYLWSDEFKEFHMAYPNVKVIYFPRNRQTSTSKIWGRIKARIRNEDDEKVIAIGVGGIIVQKGDFIVKNCNISAAEIKAFYEKQDISSDVLGFMSVEDGSLPRNWRDTTQRCITFPMIAGINVLREIAIGKMFLKSSWNTYVSDKIIFCDDSKIVQQKPYDGDNNLLEFAQWVESERRFPAAIIAITQKHGGITLSNYIDNITNSEKLLEKLREIILTVRKICNELKTAGVVHGDIHGENVLIYDTPEHKLQVSLIDFGWCSYLKFNLCEVERKKTISALKNDWDYDHFLTSLQLDVGSSTLRSLQEILDELE